MRSRQPVLLGPNFCPDRIELHEIRDCKSGRGIAEIATRNKNVEQAINRDCKGLRRRPRQARLLDEKLGAIAAIFRQSIAVGFT